MAAAHLGCIRRRLRGEMRRALLTGPRWGEIYTLLSGTEPHKSSPRTPPGLQRQRPGATVPEPRQARGDALLDVWDIWEAAGPAVLWLRVARGLWVTEASQASPGCCGDIRARLCPPELTQPGSVPMASDASGGRRSGGARTCHPRLCGATWAGTVGPLPRWRAASLALGLVNPQNSAGGAVGLCGSMTCAGSGRNGGMEVPGVAAGCWACVRGSGVWLGLGACAPLAGGAVSIVPLAGAGAGWGIQAQLITASLESPVRGRIYKHTEETGCKHSAPRAQARPGLGGTQGHTPPTPPPAPGMAAWPWHGWDEVG